MKVNEFVEMYKNNNRIDIAKVLEVQKYVGIINKREMCKLILDGCTYVVDGEVRVDSVARYILFTTAVLGIHTNLEFTSDDDDMGGAIDDYDLLCESGLLIKIIDTFQDDYASCQEILNMMTADKMQESMTLEKKIYGAVDMLQDTLSGAINQLVEKLDIDELFDGDIDNNKIVELIGTILNK